MAQRHRVKREERFLAMPLHEVDEKVDIEVRAVLPLGACSLLAVLPDQRVVVARAFVPAENAILVETHAVRLLQVLAQQRELPLAGDRRGITAALHAMGDRLLLQRLGIRSPARIPGVQRVLPADEGSAGRMADRHAVAVAELHAGLRQAVDVRRGVRRAAVTAERLATHVIGQNENDVGFDGFRETHPRDGQNQREERDVSHHACSSCDRGLCHSWYGNIAESQARSTCTRAPGCRFEDCGAARLAITSVVDNNEW